MSIERFISQHREAFDSEAPSGGLWEAIEKELPGTELAPSAKTGFKLTWGGARFARMAAAVALLVVGLGAGYHLGSRGGTVNSDVQIAAISPEHAEAASFYQRDIKAKKEKLATFASQQSEDVESDLNRLEIVMQELHQELEQVPPAKREAVISAMIENYRTRASILEKVLSHLEGKETKQQKNEPTNI